MRVMGQRGTEASMSSAQSKRSSVHRVVQWYRIDANHQVDRVTARDVAAHIANRCHLDKSAATAQVQQALFSRRTIDMTVVTYKPCELRIALSPDADPDCYDFKNIYRSINHSGFTVRMNGVDYEVARSDSRWLSMRLYDQARQRTLSSRIHHIAWTDVHDLYIY
jgi:hypothetical protein